MEKHPQLRELEALGFVAGLHPLGASNWHEISQFKKLSDKKKRRLRKKAIVVIDGALWAATNFPVESDVLPENIIIYSGNGESVGKYNRRTFSESNVERPSDQEKPAGLAAYSYTTLFNNITEFEEEKETMEENTQGGQFDFDQEMQQLAAELENGKEGTGEAPLQNVETFAPVPKTGNTKKESEPVLNEAITAALNKTEVAKPALLQIHNKAKGKFFGYIVNQAERIEFSLRKTAVKINGEKQLVPGAPPGVAEQFRMNKKIDPSYLRYEFTLGVRQTRPGKILGVALAIPLSGYIDNMKFREGGLVLGPEGDDHTLKHLVLSADQYATFMAQYFGQGIAEDPATHGSYAGLLKLEPTATRKKVKGKYTGVTTYNRKLKSVGRTSLILPNNHLPLKTFETVDVSKGRLDASTLADVNRSAFHHIVNASVPKNMTMTKYEAMNEEHRAKITKIDATTIESTFFTAKDAEREKLDVKPYYDPKGESLEVIKIPIKREAVKADGTPGPFRYVSYNTLDDAIIKDEQLKNKASLYSGEYDAFINAVGTDLINVESLRELTRKTGGSKRNSKKEVFDPEKMLKMELNLASGALSEYLEVADAPKVDFEQVNNQLYEIKVNL